jgi:hypothetical protein
LKAFIASSPIKSGRRGETGYLVSPGSDLPGKTVHTVQGFLSNDEYVNETNVWAWVKVLPQEFFFFFFKP